MILLTAQVRAPAPDEADAFEGHDVVLLQASHIRAEDRELLDRLIDKIAAKEE